MDLASDLLRKDRMGDHGSLYRDMFQDGRGATLREDGKRRHEIGSAGDYNGNDGEGYGMSRQE